MSELSTENVKYLIRWSDLGLPMKGKALREVHALENRIEELEKELKQANEQSTSESNCNIPLVSDWLSDFPENTPLYKDSGRWQLRTDDMAEIIIDQEMNESDKDFIERCKAYR